MKTVLLFIGLLLCSFSANAQQNKLLYGTSCNCKSFVENQSLDSEVEEMGVYESFPELVYPTTEKVEQYLNSKVGVPIDLILSLKISETGEVDCIYLSKGDIMGSATEEISDIVTKEFVFKPAIRRGKSIESVFNLHVSIK